MIVRYHRNAVRGLRRMPAEDAAKLREKLQHYADTNQGDVVRMQGSDAYRLRHGNWRAIFEIEGDMIVVTVAHRRDVYRR